MRLGTKILRRHPERSEGSVVLLRSRKLSYYAHMMLVAAVVVFGAQAADTAASARFDKLGHRLMCTCGCNQLLGECDHVGCPNREKMNTELIASINHGDSDDQIFHAFQDEYGPTALAAPMFTRLNRFSWWVPPIVLLLGIGGVFFLVRRWRPHTVAMPAPATDPHMLVLEQRVRMETEGGLGRKTGGDLL